MNRLRAPVALFVLAAPLAMAAPERTTIDLGGLRRARAVLSASAQDYLVEVRMLSVKSFDPATNASLNREKARQSALQALARHLSKQRKVEFSVSGARIEKTGSDGDFYTLSLRIPRAGVMLAKQPGEAKRAKEGEEHVSFDTAFFTRKRDYMHTLERLAADINADLKAAATREDFSAAIAGIEERGTINLESLQKLIDEDNYMFSDEKKELSEAVKQESRRLTDQLKAAVAKHAEKEKAP